MSTNSPVNREPQTISLFLWRGLLIPGTLGASRAAAVTINLASTPLAGGTGRTFVTADNATGATPPPFRAFVLTDR